MSRRLIFGSSFNHSGKCHNFFYVGLFHGFVALAPEKAKLLDASAVIRILKMSLTLFKVFGPNSSLLEVEGITIGPNDASPTVMASADDRKYQNSIQGTYHSVRGREMTLDKQTSISVVD
jgi:hypothetical protein